MEEAGAHMDSGVSSTTDDGQEAPEPSSARRDCETVVMVESVNEEDMTPEKDAQTSEKVELAPENKQAEIAVTPKPLTKSPQQEVSIKKIVIKSPLKDLQVRPIQRSPLKPEEPKKPSGKELQPIKVLPSSPQKLENSPESSNKEEIPKSSVKSPEVTIIVNSPESQKLIIKSPPKEFKVKEVDVVKDSASKQSPSKEQKVPPIKIILAKEQPAKVSPIKEYKDTPVTDTSPAKKEAPVTITISKENTVKPFSLKESTSSPTKEITIQQVPVKSSPVKEVQGNNDRDQVVMTSKTNEPTPKILEETSKPTPPLPPAPDQTPTTTVNESKPVEPIANKNLSLLEDKEASNDSQIETSSESSEKDHSRGGISRELRSLIKSAKESKIISECTQLTSKTRKSRSGVESVNTSLNTSVDAEKIQGTRRYSENSQQSTCSDKSDKTAIKRSMRSQNPEFASKVKNFLNSVSGKTPKGKEEGDVSEEEVEKTKESEKESPLPKKKKTDDPVKDAVTPKSIPEIKRGEKFSSDPYCWRCHWTVQPVENEKIPPSVHCSVCPRSYHYKCLSGPEKNKLSCEKSWVCPECTMILQAESSETRSPAMKKISLGMLCDLLKYALERMMEVNGVEPFMNPVDRAVFPDYDKYVVHPMDLSMMKKNIENQLYGSTEAFQADAQWILHNSIIFNTFQAKLTGGARALVRSCRAEMGEIEACPECYAAAHARKPTWFTDVCSTPHILLWAKLKGFPYWPAKGMSINSQGLVDVRFFGAHDRAWVPARDCFLYSEKDPNNFRTKRLDIIESMQEAEQHIRNISRKYGKFVYPPFRTQFEPSKLNEQLKLMIPSFEGEVRVPVKEKQIGSPAGIKESRRSHSKSSKSSAHDGDTSDNEETTVTRKMADGAEIAKEDDDFSVEKDKNKMDVDTPKSKDGEVSRKRRRSNLEEAVITIIDNSKEKRARVDSVEKVDDKKADKKDESKEPANKDATKEEQSVNKETPKAKDSDAKQKDAVAKTKESEPTTSTAKTSPRLTPIRLISISKVIKNAKTSPRVSNVKPDATPTESDKEKKDEKENKDEKDKKAEKDKAENDIKETPKRKEDDKSTKAIEDEKTSKTKEDDKLKQKDDKPPPKKTRQERQTAEKDKATPSAEEKKSKRRNSSKNKSLNNSNVGKTDKNEKKIEKPAETIQSKVNNVSKTNAVTTPGKSIRDRIQIDDDTSLAVLAKKSRSNANSGMPTITSVRSISSEQANSGKKSIEVTVEAASSSSIFTPTSTDNVKNMKEAVDKLQRIRGNNEKSDKSSTKPPPVGRVGVRAFARMTSPPEKEKETRKEVQVEIKTEPIDYEETEKQMQDKMEMMNAFKLRPVNQQGGPNLREVRINKVVVAPMARKVVSAPQPQPNMRAKKTFPQPKKPEEGRSELTCKNSMVYIPIQPPVTQAPLRPPRPAANPATPPQQRVVTTINNTTNANNNPAVNTMTTPLTTFSSPSSSVSTSSANTPIQNIQTPTVGQVPSTVHTMPLITSVNGQWTFSLQPVLSVGGVDKKQRKRGGDRGEANKVEKMAENSAPSPQQNANAASPPMLNGIADRSALLPIGPPPNQMLIPAAPPTLALPPPQPNNVPPNNRMGADSQNPGEPPRLQQRPPLINPFEASSSPAGVTPPSNVGPLTARLNQNAAKITDFFRNLLEDSIEKIDDPSSQLTAVKLQLEQFQWRHKQEIEEIKHNHQLTIAEMRSTFEKEKLRLVQEARRQNQMELDAAIKLTKSKQWCANCNQEAQFYCCWNTSYCDYPCQRAHWATHYAVCTQQRPDNGGADGNSSAPERLQQAPENLPKTTAAPNVAGKLQPGRVYAQDQATAPKPSIIVSMVEDNSGNQTMKCVGTYKPSVTQVSPLIINKQCIPQLLNNEEAKKVVTSGGYLIVGASSSTPNSSTITQARRTHAIQYIS